MAIAMTSKNRSASICVSSDQTFASTTLKTHPQSLYSPQQRLISRRASSSGSESPEAPLRDSAKGKSRQTARRSKSERLQGTRPRVKKRDRNLPLDLASATVPSGSDSGLQGSGNDPSDSYQSFLRKAPSASRLPDESYDTPNGSPRLARRQGGNRPPLPANVPLISTPDTSPSLIRKSTINSPSRQSACKALSRNPERSPTVRNKDGSHRRAGSVRATTSGSGVSSGTPGSASRRSTFLDVPDVPAGADEEFTGKDIDDDSYRLRSFDLTRKGVVNRGDSFRRRRSRSNSLAPHQQQQLLQQQEACDQKSNRANNGSSSTTQASHSQESDNNYHSRVKAHRVAIVGAHGVGKSALVSQFMTSECINAYERVRNEELEQEESVFVMLNGEESELIFSYFTNIKAEMNRSELPDAYVILYSVIDKASFQRAEDELARLQNWDALRGRALILVGNKIDLVRSRAVSTQDGKCLACAYRAKFMEISVVINHNVDELLVGILTQIRLKEELQREIAEGITVPEESSSNPSSSSWLRNKSLVRASMKAKQIFTWLFGKDDDQYHNCENFQVL